MINRVILTGRLTKDPDLRYTPNGVPVATFTLAVGRTYSNQQGERETDFINCVVWRRQAENAANYLKKGQLAGVDGRLQTRNYEGQDGRRIYVTEVLAENVQFLEPKGKSGGDSNYSGYQNNRSNEGGSGNPFNQGNGNSQGNSYNQNQNPTRNQFGNNNPNNQTIKLDEDPFSSAGNTIDISDDDLPF